MKKKSFVRDINLIKTAAYDKEKNKLDFYYLGSNLEYFFVGSNASFSFLNRDFSASLKERVYEVIKNSVDKKIKTNRRESRMGRVSLYRKNELHRGHRVFEICGGRGVEASVKSGTNRGLPKSKSRFSKMGLLEF